jgi:branched-chain amino acid transport system substrate-binding protein
MARVGFTSSVDGAGNESSVALRTRSLLSSSRRNVQAVVVVLVLVAAMIVAFPTKSSASGTKGSSGDYVIGFDDDLSGPLAFYGTAGLQDDEAAANYVNAHGGINGHKVKFVSADAAASGSNASSAAIQLIEADHVTALMGFTVSTTCAAVAGLAAAHSVPMLCLSTPASDLKPVHKFVFGINPLEAQQAPPALRFVEKTLKLPKGSTFGTIVDADVGEEGFASAISKAMIAAGYKTVSSQDIPLTGTSASPEISKLVTAKPDVVFAGESGPYYLPTVEALRAAGNDAPVIGTSGSIGYSSFISIKDPSLYGIEVTQEVTTLKATQSGMAQFIKAMATVGKTTVTKVNGTVGALPYLGALGLFQGLKKCGYPCNGTKLASDLDHVNLSAPGLVTGTYGWSSTNHIMFRSLLMLSYDATTKLPKSVVSGLALGPVTGT